MTVSFKKRRISSSVMGQVKESLEKAAEFVLTSRNEDGMWYNFLTRHHGESADWVSSFAGLNLLEAGVSKYELEKTAKSILQRQKSNGGFSYNDKIVPDADSTAFAIRFLRNFGYGQEISNALSFLGKHQNKDGGFGTYREDAIREYYRIPKEMLVEGWCASTPDITASAILVNPNDNAIKYLLDTQKEEGKWKSYWWNSDVYSTVHCKEALEKLGFDEEVSKAKKWLAKDENIPDVAFYLALSVNALHQDNKYGETLNRRVSRLVELQREDGSWNTSPILQFPMPSDKEPWNSSERWREDAKDQNRIFTTSTCAKALSKFDS